MIRIAAVHVNAIARTFGSSWMWPRICGTATSRPTKQQQHRRDGAGQSGEDTLEHERPADVPIRCAYELHHLDLATTREDREPDRVRDEDRGGREQNDHDDPEHDLDASRDLQDPLRDLLAVAHLIDGGQLGFLNGDRDRLGVLAALRDDVERRRQRVRGEVRGQRRVPLAHDLESLVPS